MRGKYNKTLGIVSSLILSVMLLIAAGCSSGSNDGGGGSTETGNPLEASIKGFVQKGPFVRGAQVTVCELISDDLSRTDICYKTQTNDDRGSFSVVSDMGSSHVEVITEGYYFNKVSGKLSSSYLSLTAIADISENVEVNVNILTTLAVERVKYLIAVESMTFEEANT